MINYITTVLWPHLYLIAGTFNRRNRSLLEILGAYAVYLGHAFLARRGWSIYGLTDQRKRKRWGIERTAMICFKSCYGYSSYGIPIACCIGEQYLLLRGARSGHS